MDRRVVTAILLMMAIAIVPSYLLRPKVAPKPPVPAVVPTVDSTPVPTLSAGPVVAPQTGDSTAVVVAVEDTVFLRNGLVSYAFSTRGARLVQATVAGYPSLNPLDKDTPARLVAEGSGLFGGTLISGSETLALDTWDFVPSAADVEATTGPATLTFTGTRNGATVVVRVTVPADDYRLDVTGTVTGLAAPGGTLQLSLGQGIRETEADIVDNHRAAALVTKAVATDAERHDITSLDSMETKTFDGQFEWVASKSKYFVAAVFAFDSTQGRLAGAQLAADGAPKGARRAAARTALPVKADGSFAYGAYVGPMEYTRLTKVGHDFDDVNPYGWPGFRLVIRFFSSPVRWLLVKMHALGIPWGVALILFGVLVRVLLWPLNQKAMRSSMEMQAIQPMIQDLQAKYKNDPQKLSQKQMELFKEHKVNPLGGCLPMLLPWPFMLALFFVFQNTIELRGAPFLWLHDLSLKDPFYVVPVLMGASMWATMKIGAMGTPPNDQQKMMTTIMPLMMAFMFSSFASGLNLYYTVQNVVSIPQQWLLLQERKKRGLVAAVQAKTVVSKK